MFVRLLPFFLTLLQSFYAGSQHFEFKLSTVNDELINDAVEYDNHFYIAGIQGIYNSNVSGIYGGLLIKLNLTGDTVKSKWYQYNNLITYFSSILINDSSEIIIIGHLLDTINQERNILYLKTDTVFNIIDERIIGHANIPEVILRARWGKHNDILCSGYALSFSIQILFYRLSETGDSLMSAYIPGVVLTPLGFDFLPFKDTVNYLGLSYGQTVAQPIPYISNQILKLSQNMQVDSVILINNSSIMIAGEWQNDSTLIVCTKSYDPNVIPQDLNFRIQRYNDSLVLWSDTLFGSVDTTDAEALNPISINNDGYVYFGGTSNYHNNWWGTDPAFYYIVKFNNDLSVNWLRYISYNSEYLNLYKVLATQDGGVLLAGTKYNAATANGLERDIYVIKLDSLGNFVTGLEEQGGLQISDFIVYPNPATSQLTVQYSPVTKPGKAILFNSLGEAVTEIILLPNSTSQKINISQFPPGIYLLRMQTEKYFGAKKFVKF